MTLNERILARDAELNTFVRDNLAAEVQGWTTAQHAANFPFFYHDLSDPKVLKGVIAAGEYGRRYPHRIPKQ